MFGLLAAVLAIVLFPVWPFSVKYAIWLISLYLLVILVGLLVFRLAVYMVCVVAGFNVWILPNLMGDYGFIESFKPFIYAERWEKSTFNIIIRLGAFLFLAYYGVQLYLDPTFLECKVVLIQPIWQWQRARSMISTTGEYPRSRTRWNFPKELLQTWKTFWTKQLMCRIIMKLMKNLFFPIMTIFNVMGKKKMIEKLFLNKNKKKYFDLVSLTPMILLCLFAFNFFIFLYKDK